MTPTRRVPLAIAALCAMVLAGAACSVKASVGNIDDTSTTTTTASSSGSDDSTGTSGTNADAPPVGTTQTFGDYTLTIIDPTEAGLTTPQGVSQVTAASITKADQPIGLIIRYTLQSSVTDETVQQVLSSQSGGQAATPITINGKQAYSVQLQSGQVVIARATEEGDLALAAGVPGVTGSQLAQAVADITTG